MPYLYRLYLTHHTPLYFFHYKSLQFPLPLQFFFIYPLSPLSLSMLKPTPTKPKQSNCRFLEDFPTLISGIQSTPKKETPPSPNQTQQIVQDFPSLVSQIPSQVQGRQKTEKQALETQRQSFNKNFPSIVSNPAPIFEIGTKQVWQGRKPQKKAHLNQSYQVPRTQPTVIPNISSPYNQRKQLPITQTDNISSCSQAQEMERQRSTSRFSQNFIDDSSQSNSQNEQNEIWPNFESINSRIKKIQSFKIPLCFPTVKNYLYQKDAGQDYSTHYEKARVYKYFHQTYSNNKWVKTIKLEKLRLLCINCDFNIPSRGGNSENSSTEDSDGSNFNRIIKEYWETSEYERAKQIVNQIRLAIFEGIDFICLQEICQPIIRIELLKMIDSLKDSGSNQYFFPKNLESHEFLRTTMILSKYPVKFGHLKFEIPEYQNQEETKFYFPLQAFCQFEVMIGRKDLKVGILTCHLRSNGEKGSVIRPHKMRQMQVRCIHDFSKRFDKFFCIGDTNIPSSEKFKKENIWIKKRFVDAFDVGKSPIGGTYMYRTKANVVRQQRMDRMWMKKEMKDNTDVQIVFREVLLQSCKEKRFNKKEMMTLDDQRLIYISPSDHQILDIGIQFTKFD